MSVLEQISVLDLTMLLFLGIERAIQSHIERASIERGGDPFVRADHNQVALLRQQHEDMAFYNHGSRLVRTALIVGVSNCGRRVSMLSLTAVSTTASQKRPARLYSKTTLPCTY